MFSSCQIFKKPLYLDIHGFNWTWKCTLGSSNAATCLQQCFRLSFVDLTRKYSQTVSTALRNTQKAVRQNKLSLLCEKDRDSMVLHLLECRWRHSAAAVTQHKMPHVTKQRSFTVDSAMPHLYMLLPWWRHTLHCPSWRLPEGKNVRVRVCLWWRG